MTSRRKRKRHQAKVASEIELMPMLNVFIAIIPLLLLSAAFVPVTIIKTTLPLDAAAAAAPEAASLDLAIAIRPEGFDVLVDGAPYRTVPRGAVGTPEADAAHTQLGDVLKELVAAHPGHREVRIVSQAHTRYEEIIQVMDVSRAAGLPEAALAEAGTEAS
jgi:biopolymer transport protein ExbD